MLHEASKNTPAADQDGKASDSESGSEDLANVSLSQRQIEMINDSSDPNERVFFDRMGTIDRRDAQNLSSLFK